MEHICHVEPEGVLYSNIDVKNVDFMNIVKPMHIRRSSDVLILDFFSTVNVSPIDYYDNLNRAI